MSDSQYNNTTSDKPLEIDISPDQRALIERYADQVADIGIDDALLMVNRWIEEMNPAYQNAPFGMFLRCLWNHFEAIRVVRGEGDFTKATALMQQAMDGFEQLRLRELSDVSTGLMHYNLAISELQKLNIGQAVELFDATIEYLERAGRYGKKYRNLIDHMKSEALYISGIQALQNLDINSGRALIDQAANASQRVAEEYHEKGGIVYCTFVGLGHVYRAHFTFVRAITDLDKFDYDDLSREENLSYHAVQARDFLAQSDLESTPIQNAYHLAVAFVECLEVISSLSVILQTIFQSTFKTEVHALALLRSKVRNAISSISQLGPIAVPLIRSCETILARIDNIEKLARPTKKDFGIYSGLVAAIAFLPILAIASWANASFNVGVPPSLLFSSCLVVALIAGFGFGATRFKSMLPWHKKYRNVEDSDNSKEVT